MTSLESIWSESASKRKGRMFNIFSWRDRSIARGLRGLRGANILDVGCGGGRKLLTRYGKVTGVDISKPLLKQAARIYDSVWYLSAEDIPFHNLYDAVVSVDVLGHIPPEKKEQAFERMADALKPGCVMLHLTENFSTNKMWTIAQKDPESFQKHFVDAPGHVGLEPYRNTIARFERCGMRLDRMWRFNGRMEWVGHYAAYNVNHWRRTVDQWLAPVALPINLMLGPMWWLDMKMSPASYSSLNAMLFRNERTRNQ